MDIQKCFVWILATVAVLCSIILLLYVAFPSLYIMILQYKDMKGAPVNSFSAEPMSTVTMENGIMCVTNISYGEEYPNSYLDIYYKQDENDTTKPTFLYIHGGGYAWGDKAEGDPTAAAGNREKATFYLQKICAAGYNVVSMNYALAPQYTYPTPLLQINQAIRFLQQQKETYNLDMSCVVISGGSAGGQLAGQYANLVTNVPYAQEMNMTAALPKEALKGVVFSCALLVPKEFAKTGKLDTDILFLALQRCYFGDDAANLQMADVVENLGADFPPCYITDGNYGTFDAQAAALDEKLTTLSVPHSCNFYTREHAKLGHGYDSFMSTPQAQDNLQKVIGFLLSIQAAND